MFNKKIISGVIALCTLLPLMASAHALPVSTTPESSATLDTTPQNVVIKFSEHIDSSASSLKVTGPSGMEASMNEVTKVSADHYSISIPIMSDGNGTYIVSWSAVSADDGHFTKGGFPFAVGKGVVVNSDAASSAEIVEVATTPEALAMTVELFGHGLLWAGLLMFAFAIRPILSSGRFDDELDRIRHIYQSVLYIGALCAVSGGVLQLLIKASDLADLRTISFAPALPLYIGTAAGGATMYRIIAVIIFATIFLWGRKVILAAKKLTPYEIALILTLCFFAYQRAKISHATSNPFHPDFSILMNFFHVIEKDIWAGIVFMLLLFVMNAKLRSFLDALIPRAFGMLAIDFGAVAVTASYIVWLHLKTFANLFTTQWGEVFSQLFIVAILLVAIRISQVTIRLWKPRIFSRFLPATIAAEFAFALFVVYFSSIVIITSPPLLQPPTPVFNATDQGASITLERDDLEDGMLQLAIAGNHVSTTTDPVVTTEDTGSTVGPISIALLKRFSGGYVFSESLLSGAGPFKLAITAPQNGAYDSHATFEIRKGAFDPQPGWESKRPLDTFTIILILIAVSAAIVAYFIWRLSLRRSEVVSLPRSQFLQFTAVCSFIFAACVVTVLIGIFHGSGLENPFRYECEGDGNMWHVMQPMNAGVPTAQMPTEGCMWGMGSALYMFGDKREYDYNNSFSHAIVTLDNAPLVAGRPTTFTVALKGPDGSPAKLFVDMEKLIHVVIVSKDESVFAHIHPDDTQPLTQQEIDTSTFTVAYTFPKAGDYMISADYAHGTTLESKQFFVHVDGAPDQDAQMHTYPLTGSFGGYDVALKGPQQYAFGSTTAASDLKLYAGEVSTITYTITKDGKPVTDLTPYLSAAMHLSIVKNDFTTFLHVHGEVHPPGAPLPPIIVKNGQVLHSMAMMMTPPTFGPTVEAHFIFPSAGTYTIWGEFKLDGKVIPTSFTVNVEK